MATRLDEQVGVRRVAPAHCTGHRGFNVVRETFRDRYEPAGLGAVVEV